MAKETNRNRWGFVDVFSIGALFVCFWTSIICAIVGNTSWIAPTSLIIYAIGALLFANILAKEANIWKRFLFFLLIELVQLIPYGIILGIRGLF